MYGDHISPNPFKSIDRDRHCGLSGLELVGIHVETAGYGKRLFSKGFGRFAYIVYGLQMQGAGAKGWRSVSSLFTKDDEHQLLEADNQPAADHPLAVKPEEPPRPNKCSTGFWDNFATKWHQAAAMRQVEVTEAGGDGSEEVGSESGARAEDGENQVEQEAKAGDGGTGNSFSKYATLGGESEDTPAFKWNFVTSKLAELKTKSMAKSN
ncbi:testis development-related protein-like [Sinocyclocheilus grahami]|uniref:testis development-related protein-like n=1 Tax=Sinocyclocheilus grahami TaxID=75366 RepID=UPI0007AC95EB|nr:PREDICTED: testis development-related protein-like [Sinocyclocheilus grahami]